MKMGYKGGHLPKARHALPFLFVPLPGLPRLPQGLVLVDLQFLDRRGADIFRSDRWRFPGESRRSLRHLQSQHRYQMKGLGFQNNVALWVAIPGWASRPVQGGSPHDVEWLGLAGPWKLYPS
jgi:hypothetical protein